MSEQLNTTTTTTTTIDTENSTQIEESNETTQSSLGEIVSDKKNGGEFDDVIEKNVVVWMKDQLNKEKRRINRMGSKSIPVDVKNAGIIKEENGVILNRLELNTSFDFDKVGQIMVSESIECPVKKGYNYITVLLFANNPIPLIVPYIYLKDGQNKLTDWLFINNQFSRSRHSINEYKDV
ncbi:hypothetical protein RB653_005550 [Dictyostelium firmibasis]|uniref:Uncharacterized protein n=1 Tax=Dictyostelium firmibasis TaxID=79012 RepID=A0AAN7U1I2_9MYCE